MDHSAVLRLCMPGGARCYSMHLSFSRSWNSGNASLSNRIQLGFKTLAVRYLCISWKTGMKSLSVLFLIGRTRILFLYYSQRINNYLLPLLDFTGNLPVRSFDIRCWGSMIFPKTWLERVSNVSIFSSLFGVLS